MRLSALKLPRYVAWIIAALVLALVIPVGALAASGSKIVIRDAKKPKQTARVVAGALRVGDGKGPMTVNGKVAVNGQVAPAAPQEPWAQSCTASSAAVSVTCAISPPVGRSMVVQSISVRLTAVPGSSIPYLQCTMTPGSSNGFLYLPTQLQGSYSGNDYFVSTTQVNTFIDASEPMSCTALRTPTTSTVGLIITAIGYLS